MAWSPSILTFYYDGPAMTKTVVRLRRVSDNEALAGADVGNRDLRQLEEAGGSVSVVEDGLHRSEPRGTMGAGRTV